MKFQTVANFRVWMFQSQGTAKCDHTLWCLQNNFDLIENHITNSKFLLYNAIPIFFQNIFQHVSERNEISGALRKEMVSEGTVGDKERFSGDWTLNLKSFLRRKEGIMSSNWVECPAQVRGILQYDLYLLYCCAEYVYTNFL